jgi:hypothetical protein
MLCVVVCFRPPGEERIEVMRSFSQLDFLRLDLRKHEMAAKSVPYVSFILTHAALVLFIISAFFIDRLVGTPSIATPVKILLVVVGVLLIAAEWIYAIMTSRRWKTDVLVLQQLEAEQRQREAEEKIRRQEEMIATEQLRNRVLQADNQRLRSQGRDQESSGPVRSVRPLNSPPSTLSAMNREQMSAPRIRSVRPVTPPSVPPDRHQQGTYPTPQSVRPMTAPSPTYPEMNRATPFPPFPFEEPPRNVIDESPFDPRRPR